MSGDPVSGEEIDAQSMLVVEISHTLQPDEPLAHSIETLFGLCHAFEAGEIDQSELDERGDLFLEVMQACRRRLV